MGAPDEFESRLARLGGILPGGSIFEFAVMDESHVNLQRLVVWPRGRGIGTRFLAHVFAVCDEFRMTSVFEADSTDMPDDPATFELVRWYRRFGCAPIGPGLDGIEMRRDPIEPKGVHGILEGYAAAKVNDLTSSEYDAIVNGQYRRW